MKKLSLEEMEKVNGEGWGERTIECMDDIYSKRGWASVVGVVLGAFAPESVAAVAVGCAIREY